jgi:hypothetical protein
VSGHFLSLVPRHRGETAWFILVALGLLTAGLGGRRREPGTGPRAARPLNVLPSVALFTGVAAALYWPALSLGFLSDDFVLLARAAAGDVWTQAQFLRPFPMLIWSGLHAATGGSAVVCHAVTIALHGLNGALVAALAWRIGLSARAATAAGLLLVCFPASVEAVAWASGIQDVLMASGALAFLLACSSPTPGPARMGLGLAPLVVALGTKETAVAVPFIALALWWRRGQRWPAMPVVASLLAVVYALLRTLVFRVHDGFLVTPSRYFVKELLSRPFGALGVPFTGAEMTRWPGLGIVLSALAIALFVVAAVESRADRARLVTVARGAAWVLLSVAPVYSMFFISADLQGSRYLYLGSCGWSILVAAMLLTSPGGRRAQVETALLAALAFTGVIGVRWHLADWQEAARVRDRAILAAGEMLRRPDCTAVRFVDVPDSSGGAYVFRNGFLEALRAADPLGSKASEAAVEARCTASLDLGRHGAHPAR